jgi:DmsE family decaheme c-type cytochrome
LSEGVVLPARATAAKKWQINNQVMDHRGVKMKLLRQIIAIVCALSFCLGGAATALAEDTPAKDATDLPTLDAGKEKSLGLGAKDIVLRGDAKCTRCHDETDSPKLLSIGKTRHGTTADGRTPTCTSCHGDSETHMVNVPVGTEQPKPDRMFTRNSTTPIAERNDACLSCHKGDNRILWSGSKHASADLACTSCHQIHAQHDKVREKLTQSEVCFSCHKTQRAQTHRTSTHPLDAGKMVCSDCHNPHGSTGPSLLVKNTVNETCYTCHAEKRGPYLWEHPPVDDDCLNCHTPHGSTNAPLLKARAPWLCQQCHGDGAPHPGQVYSAANLPNGAASNINASASAGSSVVNPITGERITWNNPESRLAFRSCANCHSQIHGSNHPGGNRFLR